MGCYGEKDVEKVDYGLADENRINASLRNNIIKHSLIKCEWSSFANSLIDSVMIFYLFLKRN